jgi:aryl-alcohol dehydrogenase-like predicted oxidoreductase
MQMRKLGESGPEVPELGFGCMGLSSGYTETDDAAAERTIHRAIELGVRHFDTADAYGNGHNESLVGRALADRRDQVTIATKFGHIMQDDGQRVICGRPEYVKAACDASLARLGIETIDLYYAHRIDPNVPVEETVGAMSQLVTEGKVRWLGLSEASPDSVRRGHGVHPLAAVQAEYSLWTRFAEDEHLGICDQLGIAYVAYSPLGRGFLSGTIKATGDLREGDRRRSLPRFTSENLDSNVSRIETLTDVAVEVGGSASQVALAWVLAQRRFIHPIPGTTSITHLEENMGAAEVTLSDEQLQRLADAFDDVAGERYPPGAMERVQL